MDISKIETSEILNLPASARESRWISDSAQEPKHAPCFSLRVLDKNRLDLSYKRNLQLLNIILISGIGTFFGYVGALILNIEKVFYYTVALILIASITYVFYKRINDNVRKINYSL